MHIALCSDEPYPVHAIVEAELIGRGHTIAHFGATAASIAANKVAGIRAALCTDSATAAGARVWNRANVLCLANRSLSGDVAREILAAWFDTAIDDRGLDGADRLCAVDERHRA